MNGWLPRIAAAGFFGIVAFYLLTEHLQHTLGALPYLVFLLCPLMHFFMHRGHGSGPDDHTDDRPTGGHHAHR